MFLASSFIPSFKTAWQTAVLVSVITELELGLGYNITANTKVQMVIIPGNTMLRLVFLNPSIGSSLRGVKPVLQIALHKVFTSVLRSNSRDALPVRSLTGLGLKSLALLNSKGHAKTLFGAKSKFSLPISRLSLTSHKEPNKVLRILRITAKCLRLGCFENIRQFWVNCHMADLSLVSNVNYPRFLVPCGKF